MEFIARTATLPNGLEVSYVAHGDPAGVPVVLLHGVTDSWRSFEPVLPLLPHSIRAYALSLRGHGDTDKPVTGYRAEDFASDVAQFLEVAGVQRAVVVGHSMGSQVAQRLAVDHPERVLGLLMIGARTTWRDHADILEVVDYNHTTMRDPVDAAFVAEFQRSTLAKPVPAPFFETVVEESLKLPARVWRAAFDECVVGSDCSAQLPAIKVPTRLLCGDLDTLARDGQASLARAIAGARLEMLENTGHALHWEEPQRFAAMLIEFVREIAALDQQRASTSLSSMRAPGTVRAGCLEGRRDAVDV